VPRALPFGAALITGASSGIGEEMVHVLGRAGVPMVVVARRADRLARLAATYPDVEVLAADLLTTDGVAAVVARIRDVSQRPIDLVVNNAGFGTSGPMHRADPERLSDEIRLNVMALTVIGHAAVNAMIPRGRGWLLNVSSVASFQANPGLAVYSATKAFVTSLSEALHEEVRGAGVVVTALCPGLTRTEFQSISNTTGFESRFPSFAWTSVGLVARAGLKGAARGRTIVVPGALYKVLVAVSGVLPRSVTRRLSRMLSRR
jgi:short-subunit dehydrogenase